VTSPIEQLPRVIRDVVRENRVLLLTVVSYVVAGNAALALMGRPWEITLVTWAFASVWLVGTALWLLLDYLIHPRRFRAALAPQRVGGALLVLLLITPFQLTFQALKKSIGYVRGFPWDERLSHWDIALHGGPPWKWLAPLLDSDVATRVVDFVYVTWFPLFVWLIVWMSWSANRELRLRGLHAFLALWILCGTFGACATPSSGPCYYGIVVGQPDPYAELLQRLDAHDQVEARDIQRWLWGVQQSDEAAAFAGVSAMPSMHVAMAVFYALVGWSLSRVFGTLLAAFAFVTFIGSVLLGWHYAIDGYAGAGFAVACWWGAGRFSGSADAAARARSG